MKRMGLGKEWADFYVTVLPPMEDCPKWSVGLCTQSEDDSTMHFCDTEREAIAIAKRQKKFLNRVFRHAEERIMEEIEERAEEAFVLR
jgi:hypothetical protein